MSENWGGPSSSGPTRGSRRRRIALSIASVVAAVVLIGLLGQLGPIADAEIAFRVLFIVGLLVVGAVFGLRPWSEK